MRMSQSPRCVLGMDLGTSSLKCVLIDDAGQLRASVERGYPTQSPCPGWAEQNPPDWIEAMRAAIAELRSQGAPLDGLQAIGLSSAAHLPVLLDEANKVVRPAILWSDQRSAQEVADLKESHSPELEQITLNEASCTWTLPQLLWVSKHEPGAFARVRRLLSSKDYLVFRLTGVSSMDYGSAAATLMMDARSKSWSSALIAVSRLPQEAFPRLTNPETVIGATTDSAARAFALPVGVPVVAGALDSAAEMLGCGLLDPGEAGMIRVGSAGGIMVVADTVAFNKGIITYPHVVDGVFYKQAGTNSCATSLKWIRDLCASMRSGDAPMLAYEQLDQLAAQAAPGADGLMFHPYLQGERAPYWNPELRGSFTGLEPRHGWPQFIRAVMEGVAFSLLDCLEMFRRDSLDMKSAVMSGGVVKSRVWSQVITDVLAMNTRTVHHGDSALGAGMLAGVGVGMFADLRGAVSACVRDEKVMVPDLANRIVYAQSFERYRRVAQFLDSLTHV